MGVRGSLFIEHPSGTVSVPADSLTPRRGWEVRYPGERRVPVEQRGQDYSEDVSGVSKCTKMA